MKKFKSVLSFISKDSVLGYLLVSPLLIWILAVILFPLIHNVYLSFTNLQFIGGKYSLIGLENYLEVVHNPAFWNALKRSFYWTIGNAIVQIFLGLSVALVLNLPLKLARRARVWVILPWIIPTIVVGIMSRWMLSPSFGVINYVLTQLHLVSEPIAFLGSKGYALPTLICINSWQWFPFFAILILSALQTIPKRLYEAAKVDGAGPVQQFLKITLPLINPTVLAVGLIGILWSFNVVPIIWSLTRGGPSAATMTTPVYIYENAFQAFHMGKSAAMSVIFFLILAIFAGAYLFSLRPFKRSQLF